MPFLPIDDPSRAAEARRLAMLVARQEGLDEVVASHAGLAATELATNLSKHANGGEIHIEPLSPLDRPGVNILSIDRGPGVANFNACLRDGYSSAGTPGTGLGAVTRVSQVFDAYSEPGKGTVILARIHASDEPESPGYKAGFAGRPISGEDVSGDSWATRRDDSSVFLLVVDGLGHGVMAADAAVLAVAAFKRSAESSPSVILDRIHRGLRGTRGAAVALARLDLAQRKIYYAGLGNIAGVIVSEQKTQSMISHHGTAGHEARHFQEFVYSFPPGSLLVMHSDGMTTSWNTASYPGLTQHHPSVIAGVLYRDSSRNRDDVSVVVIKG